MYKDRKELGRQGEQIAADFLSRRGYKIVEKNFSKPWGEIDLIAEKEGTLRFVEVKAVSREISATGSLREVDYRPEELVDRRKLLKVARTATLYMEQKKDTREYQIDVVGVIMDERKRLARCRLIEQALDGEL